jgi:hypothetical protein
MPEQINGPEIRVIATLRKIRRKANQKREEIAESVITSPQRMLGFVDALEDMGMVEVNRTVRPYQVTITGLGIRVIRLVGNGSVAEVLTRRLKGR